jgi:hypothetical protein
MKHSIDKIKSKIFDYKVCKKCLRINWYENEECCLCQNKTFSKNKKLINNYINSEIKFYQTEYEEYNLEDIMNIKIEI